MWINLEIWQKASRLNKNIILIGLMGSGKTAVGKVLCEHLSYLFLDTDLEIEIQEKKSIADIFKENGEPYFRELESSICQELATYTQKVIATGGGIILSPSNREALLKAGLIIWLKTSLKTSLDRLKADHSRPLLSSDKEATLQTLIEQRFPLYQALAHLTIQTDDKSINQIAQEIISKL